MGKRILLHVPGNIKMLEVRLWREIFNVSMAVLPGNEQVPGLTVEDESVLKGKLDQELVIRHIDRTEIRLAATIASLQENGVEAWFCRWPYLPDGVMDCFHGIISASGLLDTNMEMLQETGFPLWRVTIDNGKIQTTSPGHWFQAKEQFLQQLAARTGPVGNTGILNGVQPIPCMSDKACTVKLEELRTKLEELDAHKKSTINEASKNLRKLSTMHTPFGVQQAGQKREVLHRLYSDLQMELDNLSASLSVLPAETNGRLVLHGKIYKFRDYTRRNMKSTAVNYSIDAFAPQNLKTLEEIRNEQAALIRYKTTEIEPLSSSLLSTHDKEKSKKVRTKVLELNESFIECLKALKETCLTSMELYKTPGNAVEWEKTKADLNSLIIRIQSAHRSMKRTQSLGMEAGSSGADPLRQLAEPMIASLRPVNRRAAASATITSAQEEAQQASPPAKKPRRG